MTETLIRMKNLITFVLLIDFVSLSVCEVLKLSPEKESFTKYVGEGFYMSCSSTGKNVQRVMWTGPDGNQITTYSASKTPQESQRIHVEDGSSGHKGVDLLFRNITMKDRGQYTCSANVDGKEVEASFNLIVIKPISFTDTLSEQYLEEGKESTLICNVVADPMPEITWEAKGKPVHYKKGDRITKHPENPNWLLVQNVTLEDKGTYICSATQLTLTTSSYENFPINVKVHHKPLPSSGNHMEESYSYVTGVVNLTCEAVAEPHANFTWLKDDVIITPSDTVEIFNTDQKSILQLTVESDDMFGDYYCKAQNSFGTLERVVTLEKGEKPARPKTKLKDVKTDGFRLSIIAENSPQMPIIGYRIEYKKAGEEWSTAGVKEFEVGKSYEVNGLKDDTLYVLRASAKNLAGYSDPSIDLMKKTKKSIPVNQQLSSGTICVSNLSTTALAVLLCVALSYTKLTS